MSTKNKCPKCGKSHHPQNHCKKLSATDAPSLAEKIAATIAEPQLVMALNQLFEKGGWEIPDSAIEGKYARKIEQLESQIKSLTARMLELQSKLDGKPVEAGRVDAVAAVKGKKK